MRKSSLAHKVVDTKFSFLTYLVRIIKLMGAADLVAQSFVQNYSTFIIFHFYFQLPPVPPPPEELRQSRQHLAKVEPNVAAPLTRLPLTPPPHSMSSRQLSSDAGAATSMSLTDKRLAMFKHQPSSPDVLLGKDVYSVLFFLFIFLIHFFFHSFCLFVLVIHFAYSFFIHFFRETWTY